MFAEIVSVIRDMQQVTDRYFSEIIRWVVVIAVNCENWKFNIDVLVRKVYFVLWIIKPLSMKGFLCLALHIRLQNVQTLVDGFL
jgi:hypothetical protein